VQKPTGPAASPSISHHTYALDATLSPFDCGNLIGKVAAGKPAIV
jgi:hypothetical protein